MICIARKGLKPVDLSIISGQVPSDLIFNSVMTEKPLSRLMKFSQKYRLHIYLACLYSVLNKIFDLMPPVTIGMAVDVVVKRENSLIAFLNPDPFAQLIILVVINLVVWMLESFFEYLFAVKWRNLAQWIQHDLRLSTYSHVQDLEMSYFEDKSSAEIMAVLNDDINQLERFFNIGANDILQVSTTVIVIGVLFLMASTQVALLAFVPIPVILIGSFYFQKKLLPKYASVRKEVGFLNHLLQNNLQGIATIKSYTKESSESQRLSVQSQLYSQANEQAIKLSSAFTPLIRMAIVFGFSATLLVGGKLVFAGKMAVGLYSVLVFMIQRLLWPLTRLGETFDLYQRSMASVIRIFNLLDTPIQMKSGEESLDEKSVQGDIQFDQVEFNYPNGHSVFSGLDFKIRSGETIGIVGSTGSGKSTLVKLLLRFYDVNKGKVFLDGIPLPQFEIKSLRQMIGVVSQDVYLFHGSVKDNIAFGASHADEAEIIKAAQLAEAHDFISDLPQGYETIVGERGQKLSGGQRQRISIARAILKDPPIQVFDEATSAVDNETEALIQKSIARMSHNRTTLIIAHRLSTVVRADRILVLENGVVKEHGRHQDLLKLQGIYAGLWQVQTGALDHSYEGSR